MAKRMDNNRDNKISLDEFIKFVKDNFIKIDADKDGFLTRKEFNDNSRKNHFKKLDTDSDGNISETEFMSAKPKKCRQKNQPRRPHY